MKERPNLTQFMEQLIRALKEEERFSTAHIYQSTLNALRWMWESAAGSGKRPMSSGSTKWTVPD